MDRCILGVCLNGWADGWMDGWMEKMVYRSIKVKTGWMARVEKAKREETNLS